MEKFEAMYYPYASIQNKETLKQSLLYFDKIHVLSPNYLSGYMIGEKSEDLKLGEKIFDGLNEKFIYDPKIPQFETKAFGSYFSQSAKEREYRRNELKNETSIISKINPGPILVKYSGTFEEAVAEDLKDDYFKKLAQGKKWLLFNEKASDSLKYSYENKITNINNNEMLVEGDLAESILLNHAIFASIDKKLTPFTDELEHSRLLNLKMQRNYELMKDYLHEEGYIDDIKQNLLTKKVLEVKLSGVEGVSYTDILKFRDDNKNEFNSFRTEMGRISASISSKPWTPEFDSEVAQKIKSEIYPKVQVLEDQSKEFKDDMLVKYGKKAIIPVVLSLGATVYAGVPLSLAVIGSTILDKLRGGSIIDDILDDWKNWRNQNRNSLTYLMKLNNLSS